MKVTQIVYSRYIDNDIPCMTIFYDDGQIWPFEKPDDKWQWEPKAALDGRVMSKEAFEQAFPDAGMPPMPHQKADAP
jgi:hypothetical protein